MSRDVPRLAPVVIATLSQEQAEGYELTIYCETYAEPCCGYKAIVSYNKWIAILGPDYEPAKHNGRLAGWRCARCGGSAHSLRLSITGTWSGPQERRR